MSILNYLANPYDRTVKLYLFEILKDKYEINEKIIERIISNLKLESDTQEFIRLINNVFEKGFLASSNQYNESLSKLGINVSIKEPENNKNKIFQSEKSG